MECIYVDDDFKYIVNSFLYFSEIMIPGEWNPELGDYDEDEYVGYDDSDLDTIKSVVFEGCGTNQLINKDGEVVWPCEGGVNPVIPNIENKSTCGMCLGTGKKSNAKCFICGGTGYVQH